MQVMQTQIQALHHSGGGHARIQLNPPSLGNVQIQLHLHGNHQAQLSFTAAQPSTAQALQASLPHLSNALQQSGIQLSHAEVNTGGGNPSAAGQQGQSQAHGQGGGQDNPGREQHSALATYAGSVTSEQESSISDSGVRAYA